MPADIVPIATAILLVVLATAVLFAVVRRSRRGPTSVVEPQFAAVHAALGRGEQALREEAARARDEARESARSLREEVAGAVGSLGDGVRRAVGDLALAQKGQLDSFAATLAEAKAEAARHAATLRGEVNTTLQQRLDALAQTLGQMTQQSAEQHHALRQTVEGRLDRLRAENAEKLEQMRITVDEKLQATLEQRLGASFKQVSDSLEKVLHSAGEMKALASGVGDLKRVLTNIKSRGTWGEVALGNLLEQVMAPEQFDRNVEIRPGSGQRVEYAIRLPGDGETHVWLPLDAKFPVEDYDRLVDARNHNDAVAVETAARALEARIRTAGRDICAKYVHPPHSTDFAILFVPTEGLFAEIAYRPGLVDALQRDCHIMVAGPTNLFSLLSAVRMGFRSLAIQKRSDEVWKVLGAVKQEFGKFGAMLDKVGRKLDEAQRVLDTDLVTRRKAMERQLRAVESLPQDQATALLGLPAALAGDDEEDARDAAE